MQKVHVDDPANDGRLEVSARRAIRKFENETRRTHHKASHQRGNRARAVQSRPQDSEHETRGDWRADISLDALQINVELAADVVDERNPEQAKQHHETCGDAAEINELALGSLRTNLFIEI